jgi:hypothetical protein
LVNSGLYLTGAVAVGTIAVVSGFVQSGATAPELSGIDGWPNFDLEYHAGKAAPSSSIKV